MFLSSVFKQSRAFIKKIIYELFFIEQWQLRYKFGKEEEPCFDDVLDTYQKIIPPKDRFWADPFIIEENNKYYVFVEELEYKDAKGYISVMEIKEENSTHVKTQKILEKTYHLSYPFIFKLNGIYYMIPETIGNRTIELYQCEEFPYKWRFWGNLMENVIAADTTITFYNGKYWMFTNIEREQSILANEELHIFYSDDLLSNRWTPHGANPVIVDVKTARPAGNIFEYEGSLYRPSQDCSKRYGWAICINKILKLNENEYIEENVTHFPPKWEKEVLATHTFNKQKKLSVIDVLVKRRRFLTPLFWIYLFYDMIKCQSNTEIVEHFNVLCAL